MLTRMMLIYGVDTSLQEAPQTWADLHLIVVREGGVEPEQPLTPNMHVNSGSPGPTQPTTARCTMAQKSHL